MLRRLLLSHRNGWHGTSPVSCSSFHSLSVVSVTSVSSFWPKLSRQLLHRKGRSLSPFEILSRLRMRDEHPKQSSFVDEDSERDCNCNADHVEFHVMLSVKNEGDVSFTEEYLSCSCLVTVQLMVTLTGNVRYSLCDVLMEVSAFCSFFFVDRCTTKSIRKSVSAIWPEMSRGVGMMIRRMTGWPDWKKDWQQQRNMEGEKCFSVVVLCCWEWLVLSAFTCLSWLLSPALPGIAFLPVFPLENDRFLLQPANGNSLFPANARYANEEEERQGWKDDKILIETSEGKSIMSFQYVWILVSSKGFKGISKECRTVWAWKPWAPCQLFIF